MIGYQVDILYADALLQDCDKPTVLTLETLQCALSQQYVWN